MANRCRQKVAGKKYSICFPEKIIFNGEILLRLSCTLQTTENVPKYGTTTMRKKVIDKNYIRAIYLVTNSVFKIYSYGHTYNKFKNKTF